MAYDEELSARFRATLEGHVGIAEKKMMGGMVFVAGDAVETDAVLSDWGALALSFTTTLEPKS